MTIERDLHVVLLNLCAWCARRLRNREMLCLCRDTGEQRRLHERLVRVPITHDVVAREQMELDWERIGVFGAKVRLSRSKRVGGVVE